MITETDNIKRALIEDIKRAQHTLTEYIKRTTSHTVTVPADIITRARAL